MTGSSGANTDCIFCSTSEAGRDELILVRGRLCYVILNKYPYNNGHVMVAPARHVANLATMIDGGSRGRFRPSPLSEDIVRRVCCITRG